MPQNKRAIAGILAEKAKMQQQPFMNNPMAKPAPTLQVNPLNIPTGSPAAQPMMPVAPKVGAPGFSSKPRFMGLRKKLGF